MIIRRGVPAALPMLPFHAAGAAGLRATRRRCPPYRSPRHGDARRPATRRAIRREAAAQPRRWLYWRAVYAAMTPSAPPISPMSPLLPPPDAATDATVSPYDDAGCRRAPTQSPEAQRAARAPARSRNPYVTRHIDRCVRAVWRQCVRV